MNEEELFLLAIIAEHELQVLITKTIFGFLCFLFACLFLYVIYFNPERVRARRRNKRMSRRRDINISRRLRGGVR